MVHHIENFSKKIVIKNANSEVGTNICTKYTNMCIVISSQLPNTTYLKISWAGHSICFWVKRFRMQIKKLYTKGIQDKQTCSKKFTRVDCRFVKPAERDLFSSLVAVSWP